MKLVFIFPPKITNYKALGLTLVTNLDRRNNFIVLDTMIVGKKLCSANLFKWAWLYTMHIYTLCSSIYLSVCMSQNRICEWIFVFALDLILKCVLFVCISFISSLFLILEVKLRTRATHNQLTIYVIQHECEWQKPYDKKTRTHTAMEMERVRTCVETGLCGGCNREMWSARKGQNELWLKEKCVVGKKCVCFLLLLYRFTQKVDINTQHRWRE